MPQVGPPPFSATKRSGLPIGVPPGAATARYVGETDVNVHIEEVDVDVILGAVLIDEARIEFAANLLIVRRRVELSKLHLHGAGPNTFGPQVLREAVQALMRQLDVDELVIEGGTRVTGAATGRAGGGPRTPRRLHFVRESS